MKSPFTSLPAQYPSLPQAISQDLQVPLQTSLESNKRLP